MKELLINLKACKSSIKWAADKSWQEVYSTCDRGDWLLWLFARTNPNDFQLLTLTKGHVANTVRHLMQDKRSRDAVDAAIAFGEGKISREELKKAADAAFDACSLAAYTNAAAVSAYAAAVSAYAAEAAAYAADAAYSAARFYANDTDAAARCAKIENQKLTADICRKYLPIEIWNIKN